MEEIGAKGEMLRLGVMRKIQGEKEDGKMVDRSGGC